MAIISSPRPDNGVMLHNPHSIPLVGALISKMRRRGEMTRESNYRGFAGTRACPLNVLPDRKAGDARGRLIGAGKLRTDADRSVKLRRRYTPIYSVVGAGPTRIKFTSNRRDAPPGRQPFANPAGGLKIPPLARNGSMAKVKFQATATHRRGII